MPSGIWVSMAPTSSMALISTKSPAARKSDMSDSMACECVMCSACGGSGHIWVDFSGRYLGQHRSDDLDEMESCDSCHGAGVTELCDRCAGMDEELWA